MDDKKLQQIQDEVREDDKKVAQVVENVLGTKDPQEATMMLQLAEQLTVFLEQVNKDIGQLKNMNWALVQTFYKLDEKGNLQVKNISELLQYFGINKLLADWILDKNKLINTIMTDDKNAKLIIENMDLKFGDMLGILGDK